MSNSGAQPQGHRALGAGPEKTHKNIWRAGAATLWAQAERVVVLQSEEEKASGGAYNSLKGAYRKAAEGLFLRACSNRMK